MPRTADGWLKEDALKTAGIGEAWAKEIDGVHHEVTLRHDLRQGGYVTQHVVIHLEHITREVHAWQVGDNLPLARQYFQREVRALGGKA